MDHLEFVSSALLQQCHHNTLSVWKAILYCFLVSTAFVGSLYLLVPKAVRQLDRDEPRHIQWRSFATGATCMAAISVYPFWFCSETRINNDGSSPSALERIGIFVPNFPIWSLFGALVHSMGLYTGPLVVTLVQAWVLSKDPHYGRAGYIRVLKELWFPSFSNSPTQRRREIWIALRNKLVAPLMEEVAFRGCMIPPLLATQQFHPNVVIWVAPIFFGLAHAHHAFLRLQQGEALKRVILMTIFQFLYTTLFGVYAGHAFLRSRSIVSVVLSHSFCNTMGLPSLHFLSKTSMLFPYRVGLMVAHFVGIGVFVWGIRTEFFLPFMDPMG